MGMVLFSFAVVNVYLHRQSLEITEKHFPLYSVVGALQSFVYH